jgi:hypothetical protein
MKRLQGHGTSILVFHGQYERPHDGERVVDAGGVKLLTFVHVDNARTPMPRWLRFRGFVFPPKPDHKNLIVNGCKHRYLASQAANDPKTAFQQSSPPCSCILPPGGTVERDLTVGYQAAIAARSRFDHHAITGPKIAAAWLAAL